jgi:hypothetical protein
MFRAKKSSVELADVFRMHAASYCASSKLTPEQYKVINAILNCRTSALGGHVYKCDHCGDLQISYNSCRNRHCPKCQAIRTAQWLEKRKAELLPVQYFHLVFTLPHELNDLISYNKKLLYQILFQAAWETIKTLGLDPKRLGGLMGMIALLHTWGQNLFRHNHLHCIVPGGAINDKGWVASKKGYLFPVKVMSKIFKGVFVSKLRALHKDLKFPDGLDFDELLNGLMNKDWIVYAKEPFAGPEKLLDYLGRYTHKIAISNNRILGYDKDHVTFERRDYSDNNKLKVMKLNPHEFMRRFLYHVVPTGFMRIRFFGFLANACKAKNVAKIRTSLSTKVATVKERDVQTIINDLIGIDITLCPTCNKGTLRNIQTLKPKFGRTLFDTS